MNKNMDQNKAEAPILLQKNSECRVCAHDIYKSVLNSKGLNEQNIEINLDSNADVKYTMSVFWFMKSPDLDYGKEWHLNHYAEYKIPRGEGRYKSKLYFRSVHKVKGHNKLVRTSELMFMVSVHQNA